MGYCSINKCEIRREYSPQREIVCRVLCDERDQWFERRFPFENATDHEPLNRAWEWIRDCLTTQSM